MEDISLSVDLSFIEIVSETQEPVQERFQELFSMYLSFVYVSTLSTFYVFICALYLLVFLIVSACK